MPGSFSYLKHSFFCPQYTRKSGENASAFLGIWLEKERACQIENFYRADPDRFFV